MTLELLLAAAIAAGLVGSTHCAGMCGPVVVLFEAPGQRQSSMNPLMRRLLYNGGRGIFYAMLGAVAGLGGTLLTSAIGIDYAATVLRMLAAIMVVLIGLQLIGTNRILQTLEAKGAHLWALLSPLARHVLPIQTPARALGAGFLWGALPCGLVYSAVALAATSGNAASGAATMVAFWAGTLPALVAVGSTARQLRTWRNKASYRRVAGVVLIAGAFVALFLPAYLTDHGITQGPTHYHHR